MPLQHVPIAPLPPDRFRELLGDRYRELEEGMTRGRELFAGRVIWHVNSTSRGGGVVELLTSLLAYARGAGVDNRWVVIEGDPDFFTVTKRIHNHLHGAPGDGGELGDAEREIYEAVAARNAGELADIVRPGDVVYLHDPQTAGLAAAVRETGAHVVWRCHVGIDEPNDIARDAWDFLRPYVEQAEVYVFSRRGFVWEGLDEDRVWVVPALDRRLRAEEPAPRLRDRGGDPVHGRTRRARSRRARDLRARGRHPRPGRPPGRAVAGGAVHR